LNRHTACRVALAASLAWGACTSSSRRAAAQTAEDLASAEKLFAEGSKLVSSGRYDLGCPELERAQRLVMGIGVTLYVGACHEQRGELLMAWEQFKTAEEMATAKRDPRSSVAHERREKLWPRLAKLDVVVPPASDAVDLVVAVDGVPLPRVAWSSERPVEAGAHRIGASAPGREPWELSIEVGAGLTVAVQLPPLKPGAVAPVPPPSPATAPLAVAPGGAITPSTSSVPIGRPTPPLATQSVVAFAALGLGAVGFGVGVAFGLDAKSKMDASNANGHCQPDDRCDSTGLSLRSSALTSAGVSTAGFVVGAASLAGGLVLYFTTARREPAVAIVPRAEEGGATLLLRRQW
jgi:hypothetical protein